MANNLRLSSRSFRILTAVIGVVLLVSTCLYSINTDMNHTAEVLTHRVEYIEGQCTDYSSLTLASEAKSWLQRNRERPSSAPGTSGTVTCSMMAPRPPSMRC